MPPGSPGWVSARRRNQPMTDLQRAQSGPVNLTNKGRSHMHDLAHACISLYPDKAYAGFEAAHERI